MWCYAASEGRKWKLLLGSALLCGSLAVPSSSWAQARPTDPPARDPAAGPAAGTEKEAAGTAAPAAAPPRVTVSTGAPQPTSQNLASPLPASAPPPASGAVVKVGGNMIVLYSNNYAPEFDSAQGGARKKHLMDMWRAGIVLDAKLDRFGMHIEFRARDRGLRWMPVNSWLEEMYASADILAPTNRWGPLVLKVGKSYKQFGKPWDNSFYGSIAFRDGLKLDPNWGFSFEGAMPFTQKVGMRYFAQYFILDGQTSTVATNRDTISMVQPGTATTSMGARRRDSFVLRAEPYWKFGTASVVKLGASFDYFHADFADTLVPGAINTRIREDDNMEKVIRWGADITAQLAWFGLWAEYSHQDGQHTQNFPVAPRAIPAVPAVPATPTTPGTPGTPASTVPGSGYHEADWLLAGANFTYSRYTLQYNWSQGKYTEIEGTAASHREWIHNPSIQIAVNEQIRLIFELPFWLRKPVPGQPFADAALPQQLNTTGKQEFVEKQFLWTLHGKF